MVTFSSEMIFNVGLIIIGTAVILGIAFAIIYRAMSRRLNLKFDVEYGKRKKHNC